MPKEQKTELIEQNFNFSVPCSGYMLSRRFGEKQMLIKEPMALRANDQELRGPSKAGECFSECPELISIENRALAYLSSGFAVNLEGPAGVGKTTLATKIAARLSRPVSFISGDVYLDRKDFVGQAIGSHSKKIDDQYINRVRRSEVDTSFQWRDGLLVQAMDQGHTLIYDEFTRASPETNSILLSVLEERRLILRDVRCERLGTSAHPEFRMIFTSNPSDYVAVKTAPDALMDRIITLDISQISAQVEIAIVERQAQISFNEASRIVRMVRQVRERGLSESRSTLRRAIFIAKLARDQGVRAEASNAKFLQICIDVLGTSGISRKDLVSLIQTAAAE